MLFCLVVVPETCLTCTAAEADLQLKVNFKSFPLPKRSTLPGGNHCCGKDAKTQQKTKLCVCVCVLTNKPFGFVLRKLYLVFFCNKKMDAYVCVAASIRHL